jgi:hypothetical protein
MSTLLPDGYDSLSHHELAFIRGDGTIDIWCFGYQPTTDDIASRANRKPKVYTHVVQKVGNLYEVYDLKTLRSQAPWSTLGFTIGMPVATHEDVDAAIMTAVLID